MVKKFEFQIEQDFHKTRLDDFLFATFPSLSKMYLRDLLKSEKCEVNGYTGNAGMVLKTNDFIEIEVDTDRETAMMPQKIPLEIIFEDKQIIIINKPAGMLVHPTHREKNGTLLNGLAFYLNPKSETPPDPKSDIRHPKSSPVRPGLVHRLDKQTSGLILAAKTQRALRILSNHFKRKLVEKKYLAWVEGTVGEDRGRIEAPIGRYADEKRWDIKTDGKMGITNYLVRKRFSDKTLLEMEPVTGRTNQLRIHCSHIGHPIIGDERYGGRSFSRMCLHAAGLGFFHPSTNEKVLFETDLPKEMDFEDFG